MGSKAIKKVISTLTTITFLLTNTSYGAPGSLRVPIISAIDKTTEPSSTDEERIVSLLHRTINGDKNAYEEIKRMPVQEVLAYFEDNLPTTIQNLPESLFGYGNAYDVRGNAQEIPCGEIDMTPENFYLIGKMLGSRYAEPGQRVFLSGDIRYHTPILIYSLMLGLISVGVDVDYTQELMTTGAHNIFSAENPILSPEISKKYVMAIQISGSHGVPQKNGIKIKVDFGKGLLEPLYGKKLAELYEKREIRVDTPMLGLVKEVEGIKERVISWYLETLPNIEKDEIVVVDCRAGGAGPFVNDLFSRLGFEVIDMDKVIEESKDIVSVVKELWNKGKRKIICVLNMYPDPDMSRGIWDPSKPEALTASQDLVNKLNAAKLAKLEGMPLAIAGIFDGDADRFTFIREDGIPVPAFEMTLPFYLRFLLDPQNQSAIKSIVEAGGEPLWVICDVRANDKLGQIIDSINDMLKNETGKKTNFLRGFMINTGYPPALDFVQWRIRAMDEFVNTHPELKNDAKFMENYEHLKRTYFIAEASGHNFYHAAPNNPYRPCDDGIAAFVSLINIRETLGEVEAPRLKMPRKSSYTIAELVDQLPFVYSSGEVRIPIANNIKIPTAHKIGAWLKKRFGKELNENSFVEPLSVYEGDLLCQPKEDGFITVAGYKIHFKDGRSALVRWSNTGEEWTLLFTGKRPSEKGNDAEGWQSCIDIVNLITDRIREENLDVKNLEIEIIKVKIKKAECDGTWQGVLKDIQVLEEKIKQEPLSAAKDKALKELAGLQKSVISIMEEKKAPIQPSRELQQFVAMPEESRTSDEIARGILDKSSAIWEHVKVDGKSVAKDIVQWLGWVDASERFLRRMDDVRELKKELREEGIDKPNIVVLGTGGSGLGILTYAEIFGIDNLRVVDLEDPQEIKNVKAWIDARGWDKTIFIVSSKSWGTTETRNQERVFRKRLAEVIAKETGLKPDSEIVAEEVAQQFVAVTDEGMIKGDEKRNFRILKSGEHAIFRNNEPGDAEKGHEIGGRYSSDSYFSLVPAELAGIPHEQLLRDALDELGQFRGELGNYIGVQIGETINGFHKKGKDKITFILPRELKPFGPWVQQLINESLGKNEDSVVCITGEEFSEDASIYGKDRVFVRISIGEGAPLEVKEINSLPVLELRVNSKEDINRLQYRFKVATAVLGNRMAVHPFNQPFVEDSKNITRKLLEPTLSQEALAQRLDESASRNFKKEEPRVKVYFTGMTEEEITKQGININTVSIDEIIAGFLATIQEGDYVYLSPYTYGSQDLEDVFSGIRTNIRNNHPAHPSTLFGIGSRCQHSDNQLNNATDKAVVIVFTFDTPAGIDMDVPGRNYRLAQENMAHALGTIGALEEKGRRVIRIHLSDDYRKNPVKIKELFRNAFIKNPSLTRAIISGV